MSESELPVLIIGAGTGGLALAHGLRCAGIPVRVLERDRTRTGGLQGYRVGISPNGVRALRACLPPALFDTFVATTARDYPAFAVYTERFSRLVSIPLDLLGGQDDVVKEYSVSRMTLRQVSRTGAVVLAGHPDAPPPPMTTPAGMAGLIVDMLDLTVDDNANDNRVAFTARWIPQPIAGDRSLDGQVYLTLSPTAEASGPTDPDTTVDVRIQLITTRRHQLVEQWIGLGQDVPQVIAPHVAATMHTVHD
jgi:hypothetical protein